MKFLELFPEQNFKIINNLKYQWVEIFYEKKIRPRNYAKKETQKDLASDLVISWRFLELI